jgi:hypothetical protein
MRIVALVLVLATGVQAGAQGPAPARTNAPAAMPGTAAAVSAMIHVSAVTATNTALPGRLVRLRDARFGRLVASHTTDEAGTFTFRDVDPGSYIIELLGGDQSIEATSALLAVDAGAVVYAVVRQPTRRETAGWFAHGVAQAAAIAAAAAAAGVLAVQSTTDVSPR